jgi:hypothetical protein
LRLVDFFEQYLQTDVLISGDGFGVWISFFVIHLVFIIWGVGTCGMRSSEEFGAECDFEVFLVVGHALSLGEPGRRIWDKARVIFLEFHEGR